MGFIKINDRLKKRGGREVRFIPQAAEGARIKIMAGGCEHCLKMRGNTVQAVKNLNIPETELEIITDLAQMAKMGILSTPSLTVDGKLLVSGRALPVSEIEKLLTEALKKEEK